MAMVTKAIYMLICILLVGFVFKAEAHAGLISGAIQSDAMQQACSIL